MCMSAPAKKVASASHFGTGNQGCHVFQASIVLVLPDCVVSLGRVIEIICNKIFLKLPKIKRLPIATQCPMPCIGLARADHASQKGPQSLEAPFESTQSPMNCPLAQMDEPGTSLMTRRDTKHLESSNEAVPDSGFPLTTVRYDLSVVPTWTDPFHPRVHKKKQLDHGYSWQGI